MIHWLRMQAFNPLAGRSMTLAVGSNTRWALRPSTI